MIFWLTLTLSGCFPKIERNAQFTLGKLIEYNVMEYKAAIANISNEATQEAALEELMEGVKQKVVTKSDKI